MSDNKTPIDIGNDVEVKGPGQMLRQARINKDLTEQQVAEYLNLRPSLITEFENDIFSDKIPVTFVRGYLKNYARFVELDVEQVLASFDASNSKIKAEPMQSFSQTTRQKAENNRLMLIIYLIVFILIGLTVVWWWQESLATDSSNGGATLTEPESSVISQQTDTLDQGNNIPVTQTLNDMAEIPVVGLSSEQQPVANNLDADAALSTTIPAANATPESDSVATPATISMAKYVFTFNGDCWVNIFDADGERLAWGIKKSGYIMSLEGKAPFTITLGKPELVSIEYNQQSIDMSQFLSGQIAKFSWPKQ